MSVLFKGNITEDDYTVEKLGKRYMLVGEKRAYGGVNAPLCVDAVGRKKLLREIDIYEDRLRDPSAIKVCRHIRRMIMTSPNAFDAEYLELVKPSEELEDAICCIERIGKLYGVTVNVDSK